LTHSSDKSRLFNTGSITRWKTISSVLKAGQHVLGAIALSVENKPLPHHHKDPHKSGVNISRITIYAIGSNGARRSWVAPGANFLLASCSYWVLNQGMADLIAPGADSTMVQSRREFLRSTVLLAASAAATSPALLGSAADTNLPDATKKTLVGSNVYGWTQYADRDKKKFDIEEVISALRDTGYDYLESNLDVGRPDENANFAARLRAKGLQPVSLYTGGRFHEADKASQTVAGILLAAKVCQQSGFKVISCNADPIGREKTDEELKTQVAALSELGAGLNALGMKLGVHHHMPEMANHAREFHYNFRQTKPTVVGWCYDVHWVWKGGLPPADALQEYGDRVATWHIRQSRGGIWWEDLDTGDIDYEAVATFARAHKLPRRFSVELALEGGTKVTRSVVENHRRSREFVRRVFEG
jgi:inosose dehydratase